MVPITWSRIHVELGLSPTPLTHGMVVQAVAQRMRENEDLDWKQDLAWHKSQPADVKAKKKWEFAKDVAAMANTRGGLIIFGVRDENEEAAELTGLLNDERTRQSLRSAAWQNMKPLVDGLVIEALDGEGGAPGLIAVLVPPSADAPHIVGEKNELGVPYRYGTDTNWMSEAQLERAYRDRFTRRADDRNALTALIEELVPELDHDRGPWVAVSARPVAPLPLLTVRPERERATASIREAARLASEIYKESQRRVPVLGQWTYSDAVNNPRSGLRRWVVRSNHYSNDPHERVDWALIELHHDGAIALAIGLQGFLRGTETADAPTGVLEVPTRVVDSVVAEAVALASAHARALGGVGTIMSRAALLRGDGEGFGTPLVAIDNNLGAGFATLYHRVPGSCAVRRPVAVEAEFTADGDVAGLRDAARQLADDLNQQFGVRASTIPS